jgi:hypothetical protein
LFFVTNDLFTAERGGDVQHVGEGLGSLTDILLGVDHLPDVFALELPASNQVSDDEFKIGENYAHIADYTGQAIALESFIVFVSMKENILVQFASFDRCQLFGRQIGTHLKHEHSSTAEHPSIALGAAQ